MKQKFIGALVIFAIACSCKKEDITPTPQPQTNYEETFKKSFIGEWKEVATYDATAQAWTNTNQIMLVSDQMIGYPYNRPYTVIDADEVLLTDTNEKLQVLFGVDTTVMIFANGNKSKIVIL